MQVLSKSATLNTSSSHSLLRKDLPNKPDDIDFNIFLDDKNGLLLAIFKIF